MTTAKKGWGDDDLVEVEVAANEETSTSLLDTRVEEETEDEAEVENYVDDGGDSLKPHRRGTATMRDGETTISSSPGSTPTKGDVSSDSPEPVVIPPANEPKSPGRARVLTIDNIATTNRRRASLLGGIAPGKTRSGRRNSVRLSDSDVGFLLGKVANKISGESLRQAARDGNANLCEALIRSSVNVDDADVRGKTPLMWAVREGHVDAALHLLELGANIEAADELGMTPLMHAVDCDRVSMVNVLIDMGANVNAVASNGQSLGTICLKRLERILSAAAAEVTLPPPPASSSSMTRPPAATINASSSYDVYLLMPEKRAAAYKSCLEVCRIVIGENGASYSRGGLDALTAKLTDEWMRAKKASEACVKPPMGEMLKGEAALEDFIRISHKKAQVLTVLKIVVLLVFIIFDVAVRQYQMTPARFISYWVLYLIAYYV